MIRDKASTPPENHGEDHSNHLILRDKSSPSIHDQLQVPMKFVAELGGIRDLV